MEKKSKFFKDEDEDENEDKDTIAELSKLSKPLNRIPISSSKSANALKLKKYEPIDWSTFFPNTYKIDDEIPVYWKGDTGPNLVCLHGAGHSALSFSALAGVNDKYRIISFDYRGHGFNTKSQGEDLSGDTLVKDTIQVLDFVARKFSDETIIIVGHSMGGSIATKTSAHIFKNQETYSDLYERIQGLIVIDVVEGTAMEALPFMESIVKSRPKSFKCLEEGIEYFSRSGTIKNTESARISVPSLLRLENSTNRYIWKTNLLSSQKFWTEWFQGLTQCFLNVKVPKILLLAGSDRMDKELTIAQMQGKFKLCVLNNVGHLIHEDNPSATYEIIDNFINTFRIPSKLQDLKPIVGKLGSSNPKIIKYDENN